MFLSVVVLNFSIVHIVCIVVEEKCQRLAERSRCQMGSYKRQRIAGVVREDCRRRASDITRRIIQVCYMLYVVLSTGYLLHGL